MPTIAELARNLATGGLPVLLLDACALLDVLRAPARNEAWQIAPSLRVHRAATANPPQCAIVIASLTRKEFEDHADTELALTTKFLEAIDTSIDRFNEACRHLGFPTANIQFRQSPLPDELAKLAKALAALAVPIVDDAALTLRATARVINKIPPARKGAVKDSIMTEEFLELVRQTRAAGATKPVVFLSSNINDFCSGAGRVLAAELAAEFDPLALKFATKWTDAALLLGIP